MVCNICVCVCANGVIYVYCLPCIHMFKKKKKCIYIRVVVRRTDCSKKKYEVDKKVWKTKNSTEKIGGKSIMGKRRQHAYET